MKSKMFSQFLQMSNFRRTICCTLLVIAASALYPAAHSQYYPRRHPAPYGRGDLESLNPFDESGGYFDYFASSIGRIRGAEALVRERTESGSAAVPGEASSLPGGASCAPALDSQFSTMQVKLMRDHAEALNSRIGLVKNQIVFLRRQLNDDLGSVVKYPAGTRQDGSNREYERTIQSLKVAFATKVDNITLQLAKDCLTFENAHSRRMSELATSKDSLKTQMNSQVGSNKVVSTGTNMYVRNYVNFGGIDPASQQKLTGPAAIELKASPGKISSGTGGIKQK